MAPSDVDDAVMDEARDERPHAEAPFLDGFSVRVRHCLGNAGITTPEDLARSTPERLLEIPQFGAKCLNEVSALLDERGLPPLGSAAPVDKRTPRQAVGSKELSPRIRELLKHNGVRSPSDLRGKGLREVLSFAGLDEAGADELVAVLSGRGLLQRPKSPGEFLLLLASSAYARGVLEERAPLWMGRELDAIGECAAKAEEQVGLGTLHERALMRFGPVSEVNARFRPPERLFLGFLHRLQHAPGHASAAQIFRVLESLDVPTLDDEMEGLFARFDERSKDILRQRFAPGRRLPTLQNLGDEYAVSRERIRQIEHRAADELRQECESQPLPRARTATLLVRDLVKDPTRRHPLVHREPVHRELAARGLARSERAVEDLIVVWKALEAARSRARGH